MPIPALEVIILIPEVADIISIIGYSGIIGGSVGAWCGSHRSCNRKRGIAGHTSFSLKDVPQMQVEERDFDVVLETRQAVGPCGVPMYNFDICKSELAAQSQRVTSSIPSPGVAQFDNIPPACMDLASVLGGSCNGVGVRPIPCGSACMQWVGLSDAQMGSLSLSLQG